MKVSLKFDEFNLLLKMIYQKMKDSNAKWNLSIFIQIIKNLISWSNN